MMGGVIFSLIVMTVMVISIMALVMRGTGVLPRGRQSALVILPMLAPLMLRGLPNLSNTTFSGRSETASLIRREGFSLGRHKTSVTL